MSGKTNNKTLLSAVIAVFCFYYSILLLLPGYSLLQDPDTFWHIHIGQWILNHGQVPTVDSFSYTEAGKPWISTEWLSEILFALAFNLGEWRAVVILTASACAVIIGLLCYYLLHNVRFSVAIGWTALTAVGISGHFLARPHIFSYVLLIIWMIKLFDTYDRDDFKLSSLFLFVPVMALWANLHGSFTLGLALFYLVAGLSFCQNVFQRDYSKAWRTLLVAAVVTVSALMTPYGINSVLETAKAVKMSYANHHVSEMAPPDFQGDRLMLLFFVGLLAAIIGFGVQLRGARLIVFCVIAAMALSYVRGMTMFFLLAPIILARPVAACASYLMPKSADDLSIKLNKEGDPVLGFLGKRAVAVPAFCLVAAALATASVWARTDIAPSKSITPTSAVDFVRRTGITGNVLNSYDFGGFLIFSGIPTFIDGRTLLFGDTFLQKYNEAANLIGADDSFGLLDEYKVSWTILEPTESLAKALARSPKWDKVYSDKYSVVFTRHPS